MSEVETTSPSEISYRERASDLFLKIGRLLTTGGLSIIGDRPQSHDHDTRLAEQHDTQIMPPRA